MKSKVTGRSSRTPVKHYLLNSIVGKIAAVLCTDNFSVPCKANPFFVVDLCGGDGLENDLHQASPKILWKHCVYVMGRGKPAKLDVIEKNANTFEVLRENTTVMVSQGANLIMGDAREYTLPKLKQDQAAFVHCDPNTVDQTPLTKPFVASFNRYTTYLVTLGCNVSGLKREPLAKRAGWFQYVDLLCGVLPKHHDAILFWLNRDDAQWAYLLSIPDVWSEDFQKTSVQRTSEIWEKGVSAVSYRRQRREFHDRINRLFLTGDEYDAK